MNVEGVDLRCILWGIIRHEAVNRLNNSVLEDRRWNIVKILLHWYFRYWLCRRSSDDERKINRWKRIVSRFRGKLVKMIKDSDSKLDDYSVSSRSRQNFIALGVMN